MTRPLSLTQRPWNLSQSFKKASIPLSVSGCFAAASRTLNGTVAMSRTALAASMMWRGGANDWPPGPASTGGAGGRSRPSHAHDLETFLRNIVEPANERADDVGASERREERLIGAEAERHIRANLLLLQLLDRRPAIRASKALSPRR